MNKLMFLILHALTIRTSASTSHPSSNVINPHPHAHCASSETLSQLVNRTFLPIAILIDTGANLTNRHQLCPAIESTAATPLCSNSSTVFYNADKVKGSGKPKEGGRGNGRHHASMRKGGCCPPTKGRHRQDHGGYATTPTTCSAPSCGHSLHTPPT
jgi:hypothetical protein